MSVLRNFNLKQIKDKYQIDTFLETGTAEGDGIEHALNFHFKDIISIEIIENQVLKMKQKFKNYNNVSIILGNSTDVFKNILPYINDNIIFWLDAHYPGADITQNNVNLKIQLYINGPDNIRLPLEHELLMIKELRKNKKDVILLDDLNIYKNQVKDDAFYLKPKQTFKENFFKNILNETHAFESINNEQGMLIPR